MIMMMYVTIMMINKMPLTSHRPKTARTRNSKSSYVVVNAESMVLVRTAIKPSKKHACINGSMNAHI